MRTMTARTNIWECTIMCVTFRKHCAYCMLTFLHNERKVFTVNFFTKVPSKIETFIYFKNVLMVFKLTSAEKIFFT